MNSSFDITIIGSGLLSAKIALIAAKQGSKVCLLSEKDFGDIGSFNTVDIVDGNNIVYENYANNFIPVDVLNIDTSNSSITKLYKQFLSKITSQEYKNSENLLETEPQLHNADYATITKKYKYDYARVCIDTVLTAKEYGAHIFNYVKLSNIGGNIIDYTYLDQEFKINTKQIIDVRKQPKTSAGTYFSLPRFKLELANSILINYKDSDIQIVPYFSVIIVRVTGSVSKNEALEKINSVFNKNIVEKEILDFWNGFENNSDIEISENKLLLTETFSIDNAKILKQIFTWIAEENKTDLVKEFEIPLHNNFTFEKRKTVIYEQVDKTFREVQQTNISPNEFTKLYYRYGSKFSIVIEKAYDYYSNKNNRNNAWLMAQVWYAKEYEMAKTPEDFIYRRANTYFSNYFDKDLIKVVKECFTSL